MGQLCQPPHIQDQATLEEIWQKEGKDRVWKKSYKMMSFRNVRTGVQINYNTSGYLYKV